MKIDNLTGAAIAFAALATWYVFKPKTKAEQATNAAYDMATKQRREVGAAVSQNYDYLQNWQETNLSNMGGGQGLQPPSKGFWAAL
jgi:hypothetical protein